MNYKILILSLGVFSLAGCATHSLMRGSVAMKVSDTEAHVCLGDKEVKVGDKVNIYKSECTQSAGSKGTNCVKVKAGEGSVTQLLNEHYSVIKFDKGVEFKEGTIVEKE